MLIGIDQVLLDVIVPIDDDPKILERYQIQPLSQCLAEERHMPLVKEALAGVESGKASACPGGVIANSLRAGSWWLKKQSNTAAAPRRVMLGRIGQDSAGKRLQEEISASGVEPMFDQARDTGDADAESSSGTCCCFLAEKARTMVTHLGASKTLNLSGTSECPSFDSRMDLLKTSLTGVQPWVVLVSGFYVQADPAGVAAVRSWCSKRHITAAGQIVPALAMTVGAEWCTELEPVQAAARSADFTFANEAEVMHLASSICKASSKPVAPDYDAAMLVIAKWKERGWMIGTRGSKGVGYIHVTDGEVRMLQVPPVPPEEFKDDVGAGDAFMGGFVEAIWQRLHALAKGAGNPYPSEAAKGRKRKLEEDASLVDGLKSADIEDAVRGGITAAAACIRCSGCQFPS